jgi:predicted Zn-dependent protease
MSQNRLFKKAGVEEFDLYKLKVTVNEVQLRGFEIEIIRDPVESCGYTVRVLSRKGGLSGLGQSSCSGSSKLEKCIHDSKHLSQLNLQKTKYEFPSAKKDNQTKIADDQILKKSQEAVQQYAKSFLETLKAELKFKPSVKPTFGKIRTYVLETLLENCTGLRKEKTETYFYLELALKVFGSAKELAEFWPRKFSRTIDAQAPDKILPKWIQLAEDTLKTKMPATGKMSVILDPRSVCDLLVPTVGVHAMGEMKFKKQTLLNKEDQVASDCLTIQDDGLLDYGLVSSPFDDEGNAQRTKTVIEKGVFKDYLYDQRYALNMNETATGNGLKSLSGMTNIMNKHTLPVTGSPTNFSIKPGNASLEDMVSDVKNGILVEQFSWLNPAPLSTSFSSEIRNAYEIKDGEYVQALKGGMVSGKVLDIIKNISAISNQSFIESGATAFSCVSPYIRFEDVQIVGK